MDVRNSASNRKGSKTLEEVFIDEILDESQSVETDLAQVLAVVLLQNGKNSDAFKYVEERLTKVGKRYERSVAGHQKFKNLIGATAIVGNLSNAEMEYRCKVLIERLGTEKAMEIIHQIEAKRELPEKVVSFSSRYLEKKRKILASNQPKGNGAA